MIVKFTKPGGEPIWINPAHISLWDECDAPPGMNIPSGRLTVLSIAGSVVAVRESGKEVAEAIHRIMLKGEDRQVRVIRKIQREDWEE